MERELEKERGANFQATPLRKTARTLQSTFFIGVMPILVSLGAYRLLVYLDQFDTGDGPLMKATGNVVITGVIFFISFVIGMGLTGRRVDLSDQGLVAQFFGRIGVFILNGVLLGALIFVMRSCGR